jgi:hypothetical protein
VKILGILQMPCHEDSRYNRQHSFAALVHAGIIAYSYFVRLHSLAIAGSRVPYCMILNRKPNTRFRKTCF